MANQICTKTFSSSKIQRPGLHIKNYNKWIRDGNTNKSYLKKAARLELSDQRAGSEGIKVSFSFFTQK